jgi:hypothetical protein
MKSTGKEKPVAQKRSAKTPRGIGKGKGSITIENPMADAKERTQQTNNLGKYGEGEYDGSKTIDEDRLHELKI